MARVKGRDVLIDVLEAVHSLEATSAKHTEQLEEHARLLTKINTDVTQLKTDVAQLYSSVRALSDDFTTAMESGNKMAEIGRVTTQQVGRLAKTLGSLATEHSDRMGQIESRLDRLERKAS